MQENTPSHFTMKDLYIVANWKENKTQEEVQSFMSEFSKDYEAREYVKVVICPAYLTVPTVAEFVKSNNVKVEVGVQDVSRYQEGAHTGEVSAREAAEYARFAIIGHSERRTMGETDEDVKKKVEMAKSANIEPIVCVVNERVPIPPGVKIVAYEPVEAIGTGNPDTPENAEKIASQIRSVNQQVTHVLYGGSVNAENVASYTNSPSIGGVLIGGASLDPSSYLRIIKAC
jgi:triosephosphate isomerase